MTPLAPYQGGGRLFSLARCAPHRSITDVSSLPSLPRGRYRVDPQGGSSGKTRASDVLEQYGRDALRLAEKLADVQSDNYRLREERRTLKQRLAETTGKVPASDARVLTKDEADEYSAYVALGKPAAIKQAIDANGVATAELTKLRRTRNYAPLRRQPGSSRACWSGWPGSRHSGAAR